MILARARRLVYRPDSDGVQYVKKKFCEWCGSSHHLTVDHIIPISKGGSNKVVNKQTLCFTCNAKKADTIETPVYSEFVCERYHSVDLSALVHAVSKFKNKKLKK